MPCFFQRTLFISLSAIALVLLTALTLTPHAGLNTLPIPSPFTRTHEQASHQPPHESSKPCEQQASLFHQEQQQQPTWLLATSSAYFSQRRRNIIRATWQTLYPNPAFDTRFLIAKPSPLWQSLISHENDTYGDLIVLEELEESREVANTIKIVEFLKRLVAESKAPGAAPPWKFVSKIDDDSFLSAECFYQEFLLPRIHQRHPDVDGTLIARRLIRTDRNFSTPGGQFYTLSWDLARLVAETHARNPIVDLPEDVLIGRLLYEAEAKFDFVELDDSQAFDVTDDLKRLGKANEDLGPIDGAAINPHKMKDDETYLRVAGLFGKDGFVGNSTAGG